jgi:hypothetical protein
MPIAARDLPDEHCNRLLFAAATTNKIAHMFESYVVPEQTVTQKGDSEAMEISALESRVLLLTLCITDIVEQESLDVSIWGSADGSTWSATPADKSLASFPQKFYRGEHPLLLDLSKRPEIKFLRAHWEVNRWGRGSETPMFRFSVQAQEVPKEVLAETAGKK